MKILDRNSWDELQIFSVFLELFYYITYRMSTSENIVISEMLPHIYNICHIKNKGWA